MMQREITRYLELRVKECPVVTVLGPRQSGKTTLCRDTFPGLAYANLEASDVRQFAESDPRGFLAQPEPDKAIMGQACYLLTFTPQQTIWPSVRMPQVWKPPALTSRNTPPGGEDCSSTLSPQQARAPSVRMPQA